MIFTACQVTEKSPRSGAVQNAAMADPGLEKAKSRCEDILTIYQNACSPGQNADGLTAETLKGIEAQWMDAGFGVIDTNGDYPSYLSNPGRFYDFWENVRTKSDAKLELVELTESGNLQYTLFQYEENTCNVFYAVCELTEDKTVSVLFYEQYAVEDMELSDGGNFYYRTHPAGDKHYADYIRIRLQPPDQELYNMTRKYILPVGYVGVNLFLCDWTEGDYGDLSFNDLWDSLYCCLYGRQCTESTYSYRPDEYCYEIPQEEFEEVIQSYFDIDAERLRDLALYAADGGYYPWRPIETNDFVHLWYYVCEPEVTAYQVNPDATMTLTVEALSTDLKMDCLFAHEVTIRLCENGRFQYVGNKVTYQTEYGLPENRARVFWEKK